MPKSTEKNIQIPLPEDLYNELRVEAKRCGQPVIQIVRDAIRKLLEERKRRALHSEICAYAEEMAGKRQGLDSELEAATVEYLKAIDLNKS